MPWRHLVRASAIVNRSLKSWAILAERTRRQRVERGCPHLPAMAAWQHEKVARLELAGEHVISRKQPVFATDADVNGLAVRAIAGLALQPHQVGARERLLAVDLRDRRRLPLAQPARALGLLRHLRRPHVRREQDEACDLLGMAARVA